MRFSNPVLDHLLRELIESGDAVLRARAENFRFEERVDQARQARYETAHGPAEPA
jgi:hypothetical protein